MRLLIIILTVTICTLAIIEAVKAEPFVQMQGGLTWFQSDYNSNHKRFVGSTEGGFNFKSLPLTIMGGITQSGQNDDAVSKRTHSDEFQYIDYDVVFRTITIWVMPRLDIGDFSLAAGPGYGTVHSNLKVDTSEGLHDSSKGWQDNVSLRADLTYHLTPNVAFGFTYRQDYFEVELDDRDVSDYEVNQDRVYYLINARLTF